MNIILFGPPGAGKGTQSKHLIKKTNGFQISTGDILRDEIKKNTDLGKLIKEDMNNGKFVDDDIVHKIIKKIIFDPTQKNKLIFDGYPRSLGQAKSLEILMTESNQKIDLIIFLDVSKDTIIKRIQKRKVIENRSDDEMNTIIKRHDAYMKTTKPVLDFYSKNSNFHRIDGSQEIEQITRKIDTFINV